MCPYAIHNNPNSLLITCGPLNKLCTMCFMGNSNQYKECEELENERGVDWWLFDGYKAISFDL